MQTILPSFYPAFRCRAENCKHSCCKGWEIDIDEETAAKYRSMSGPLSEEIRSHITEDNGVSHFLLTPEGNCPMLQEDGLCRLILARGEEDLCDICALHPRFFEEYGEQELWGLGLSCEEACDLLLSTPLRFFADGSESGMTMQELLDLLAVEADPADLSFYPETAIDGIRRILTLFHETEPIDEQWPCEISRLMDRVDELSTAAQKYVCCYDHDLFQKIFDYILYRQLERLPAFSLDRIAAYARLCSQYIFLRYAFDGEDPEHVRRFSEQVEYSEENTNLLLTKATEIM